MKLLSVTAPAEITAKIARVPNTNKHSVEGSNPMWLRNFAAFESEWYKNDDDNGGDQLDSIDENVIVEDFYSKRQNDQKFNLYQQIEKLHAKSLETTELWRDLFSFCT